MLYHGAEAKAFNLKDVLMETLTSMRRAGWLGLNSFVTIALFDPTSILNNFILPECRLAHTC